MAAVRTAMTALGIDDGGEVSLLKRLFGFVRGRVPVGTGPTSTVSLLALLRDVQHEHIQVNVIRVGFDLLPDEDASNEKLDWAILRLREIYRQVDLGVGPVEHYFISSAEADGLDNLGSEGDANQLSRDWTIDNDGLDVFVVRVITDPDWAGRSPVGGSCNKNTNRAGAVGGEIANSTDQVARTFAHEIGHYLGLHHTHGRNCPTAVADRDNLMAQSTCAVSIRSSVDLTGDQGDKVRDHCAVRAGV